MVNETFSDSALPPRPDAICTFLCSNDFAPGTQTLLYSIKQHLSVDSKEYPPELVVFVTSNVSTKVREKLCPAFCTRILEVPVIPIPNNNNNNNNTKDEKSHVSSWDGCGYTKLNIFQYENYHTILYIDSDCLVLKDVKFLLQLSEKQQQQQQQNETRTRNDFSDMLVAAAPDIFPPDKFNGGVLILRPSEKGFQDMMEQTKHLPTYDGGDTGFLNSYFSTWYKDMPPTARLPFGCNAQRFMHSCTYDKQPNYWDMGIEQITIVHYSSSPKPWQGQNNLHKTTETKKDDGSSLLSKEDESALSRALKKKNDQLDKLWNKWYEKSKKWFISWKEEEEWKSKVVISASKEASTKRPKTSVAAGRQTTATKEKKKNDSHLKITKRYKELRKSGLNSKDAMLQATAEIDGKDSASPDPASQVASMFGLTM